MLKIKSILKTSVGFENTLNIRYYKFNINRALEVNIFKYMIILFLNSIESYNVSSIAIFHIINNQIVIYLRIDTSMP